METSKASIPAIAAVFAVFISAAGLVFSSYALIHYVYKQKEVNIPSSAKGPYVLCIGEYPQNCPKPFNAYFSCGTTDAEAAKAVCKSDKYHATRLLTQGGNRCGYAIIQAQCD